MPPRDGDAEQAALDLGARDPADHDHLTGLWNRGRFEHELDRRIAGSLPDGERLALLLIDVDGYRDVIRRHGPDDAEALIRSISEVMAKRFGPNETLARMGGDEFAALLLGTTPCLARTLAGELCAAVRAHSHAVGSRRIQATISVGGVLLDPGAATRQEALLAADTALYEAKVAGCDRAIIHE